MGKSIIGIVPLVDYEKESYWMLPGYAGCHGSRRLSCHASSDGGYGFDKADGICL